MKFTTLSTATIAALMGSVMAAPAAGGPEQFQLQVKSTDGAIDGTLVTYLHEGAGINYAFIDTPYEANYFFFNETALLSQPQGLEFPYGALITNNILEIGVLTDTEAGGWQIGYSFDENNVLNLNGHDGFFACTGVNDPYHYEFSAVSFYPDIAPENCEKISLVRA